MKEAWLEQWLGVAAVALIVVGIVVLVASALGVGDGPVQAYPFTGMMGGGGGGMMGGW